VKLLDLAVIAAGVAAIVWELWFFLGPKHHA
jgi:hypothetical protein